jgi:hypothetical protein
MSTLNFKQWLELQDPKLDNKSMGQQVASAAKRGILNPGGDAAKNVKNTVAKLAQQTKDPAQLAKLATASDTAEDGEEVAKMKKKMKK